MRPGAALAVAVAVVGLVVGLGAHAAMAGTPGVAVTVSLPASTATTSLPTTPTTTSTTGIAGIGTTNGAGTGTGGRRTGTGNGAVQTSPGTVSQVLADEVPVAPTPAATPKAGAGGARFVDGGPALGGQAHLHGDGFTGGEQVQLVLYSDPRVIGSFPAAADGTVDIVFTVPADLGLGRHTAELTGWSSGHVQNAVFVIDATNSPAAAGTGASTGTWRWVLVGVLAAAALATWVVIAARRREREARV